MTYLLTCLLKHRLTHPHIRHPLTTLPLITHHRITHSLTTHTPSIVSHLLLIVSHLLSLILSLIVSLIVSPTNSPYLLTQVGGGAADLMIITKLSSSVHLTSPCTCQRIEVNASKLFSLPTHPLTVLLTR